jgi:GAF domain-containing protein
MNEHVHSRPADDSTEPVDALASPGPSPRGSDAMAAAVPALAELATIVLGQQPLGLVLTRVAQLAQVLVPGVDDASITLIQAGRPSTVAFAGKLAAVLDERQYEDGFGPCTDAAVTGQIIMVEDTARGDLYPGFSREAHRAGIHHSLSVGMTTVQDVAGALNLYGAGPAGPFDQDARDIATAFAGYAGVAVLNAATHAGALAQIEQMKQAMTSRAGIEQAKGILMNQRRCTPDEAFAILVTLSSQTNRKLRDVAADVVRLSTEQR